MIEGPPNSLAPGWGETHAMLPSSPVTTLAEFYASESLEIRRRFETTGDGRTSVAERAALIDAIVERLHRNLLAPDLTEPKDFCLVALGGYGRRELFPCSDVDLLFLSANGKAESSRREAVATMVRTLWDLRLRVGNTSRTLPECSQFHRDNPEFNLALLDCRYVAGDPWLFARLRGDAIPHLVARDGQDLIRSLVELTRQRHKKHGKTVFHLEPEIKEAPGGLRDYQVARWLTLINELERQEWWTKPEEIWPSTPAAATREALEFLSAARCFLHYFHGRDDNQLSYESQGEAASLGTGHQPQRPQSATDWMRSYFRHARSIDRLTAQLLEEIAPARSSLYSLYRDWRSRVSNADFAVVRGKVYPRLPPIPSQPQLLLSLFEMVARHGVELSRQAERWVEEFAFGLEGRSARWPGLWPALRRILVLPHAAEALRGMHQLGLLVVLFPEFRAIDCLVVRDYFHRYTVDEHSLMTIQGLHALRGVKARSQNEPRSEPLQQWEQSFSEILDELEKPELLFLSLLFHDVGKGMSSGDHVKASLEAVEAISDRLALEPLDRETVCYLTSSHLEMSATLLRRDIFDPQTIRAFAERGGTPERLKMLTLLTYADIKAVNPEALTPWKAEMLWQLYVVASNRLTRSVDEERVHIAQGGLTKVERVRSLLPESSSSGELNAFLEGFPRRYLDMHSAEEIAVHYKMARKLAENVVQVNLRVETPCYEMTVVTADRPFLFASLTGTLAAWGMNILKADAFSNASGTVLDTFRFVDLFRTLELNPSERERLQQTVVEVLTGKASLAALMKGRVNPQGLPRPKVTIPTQILFDDASSHHSTLLELVTQDRPGLLYQVSSVLAELGCNIEVVLIDTAAQKVIDVFYLTYRGARLAAGKQEEIRHALLHRLAAGPFAIP